MIERWKFQKRMILLFIHQVTKENAKFGNPSLIMTHHKMQLDQRFKDDFIKMQASLIPNFCKMCIDSLMKCLFSQDRQNNNTDRLRRINNATSRCCKLKEKNKKLGIFQPLK